ncbi:MAG: L,D-transpeptidase, partial [Hyphomicrobium sp.]
MRVSLVRGVLLVPAFLAALGLAAGAVPAQVQAEPSQTGATAVAASIAEVPGKSPAAAPGDGQLKPDAATIDTAPKSSAASSTAAGSAASVAGTTAEPAPPAAPPPIPTLLVGIDLGSQRLTVTEHGRVKYTWPISSGREGYRTPTGSFRPSWMAQMWYSKQYDDAPMPHAVFFNGGIAVHATQSTGMLGRPASHGCI